MGSEREVCPKCDRQVATDDDWNAGELDQQIEGGPSPRTEDLCWGGHQCNDAAVDWRTRAHAAESLLVDWLTQTAHLDRHERARLCDLIARTRAVVGGEVRDGE